MALELIYTSAERGLRPGTRGFCTVAYTQGMPPELVQVLEALSAYKNLYPLHDARFLRNPVGYSHFAYTIKYQQYHILSRVGPTEADHTQRDNKLAHHLVLSKRELCEAGPAWLAAADGFFADAWNSVPGLIEQPRAIPAAAGALPTRAETWELLAGDAGWAGSLAYHFLSKPGAPVCLLYEPGAPVLALFAEALALVPPDRRWQVTFNTYHSFLPAGTTCAWRGCPAETDAAREARRQPRALVLDLTKKLPALADANPLVACARRGLPIPPEFSRPTLPPPTAARGSHLTLHGRNEATGNAPAGGFLSRWKDRS